MLIILFGLAGSGKNFVGDILEKQFNYHFYDADNLLPEDLKNSIKEKIPFTQDQRDSFTQLIIKKIAELIKIYPNLVIAQGLYKELNRLQILEKYPDALFVWIKASSTIIDKRLKLKPKANLNFEYARTIANNFEIPKLPHSIIQNEEDKKHILEQLKLILKQ